MINIIIMLEDALRLAGHEDYEIRYLPEVDVYSLTLDGEKVFLMPDRVAKKDLFGEEEENE